MNKKNKGGDAGEIFIFSKKIAGSGNIQADGGNGDVGGKGGKVTLISDINQFVGKVTAHGGFSITRSKWWENTWIQVLMLVSAIVGIIGFVLYLYER